MPWKMIAQEIADGVKRQDARLESAEDMMSIEEPCKQVEEWRNQNKTVNKLIDWRLFPENMARKTLAQFAKPGEIHVHNGGH